MERTSGTGISWIKLIVAVALSCSISGFSAMAQTDSVKPLDARSLTALVEELKGVVANFSPNEKDAALVAEKWERRKDLAGKTKSDVIKLLYGDVKAVIKDSGVLYQIYSIFSFYKRIPDDAPSAPTQTTNSTISKPASVKKLVELTHRMHPFVGIDELVASLPGTEEVRAEEERVRQVRRKVFDDALKVNGNLTPDQKSFVKANYDRLSESVDKIIDDTIQMNFPTEQWVKEGLQQSYTAKFSLRELTNLVAYFQGTAGRQVLRYVRLSNMVELITGNGGRLDYTEADKAEYDKFMSTPLGKKFMTAFITDAEAYEKRRVNAVMAGNSNADGFAILEPENLNQLFNKYVSENYRT
jgi:hypothetical protein